MTRTWAAALRPWFCLPGVLQWALRPGSSHTSPSGHGSGGGVEGRREGAVPPRSATKVTFTFKLLQMQTERREGPEAGVGLG